MPVCSYNQLQVPLKMNTQPASYPDYPAFESRDPVAQWLLFLLGLCNSPFKNNISHDWPRLRFAAFCLLGSTWRPQMRSTKRLAKLFQ